MPLNWPPPHLQTAHPVGQHHLGNPGRLFETLGQKPHCRLRLLIAGEADETPPRPGQDGAEHLPWANR
jgi:hypothetical protein